MATKSLYVGNIPYSLTEADLLDAFAEFGASQARIVEGRGFGFIDVDEDKAEAAINAKHNSTLGGRSLTVNEARPREERPRREYGGGGGGGNYGGGGGGYGGGGGGRGGGGYGGGGGGGRGGGGRKGW